MRSNSAAHARRTLVIAVALLVPAPLTAQVTFPPNFSQTLLTDQLASPTAMQFAPDGRLFVCEQGGRLRVIKNGVLLPTPFVTLSVDTFIERGLLGVAFAADFTSTQQVYVYYSVPGTPVHNRVSRFTASGDVAVPGSEVVVVDLDPVSSGSHNGGNMAFGPDGKLYLPVGDDFQTGLSQSLSTRLGKILRLDPDGTIPADNPATFPGIAGTPSGANRAIWAVGLRNPFTLTFNPAGGTPAMMINDVGQDGWEEVNTGARAMNYGWPDTEGDFDPAQPANVNYTRPNYAYPHTSGSPHDCSITGGAFYPSAFTTYPSAYQNAYFFADYCGGWIKRLDPTDVGTFPYLTTPIDFAAGLNRTVDLKVGADGNLYHLSYTDGTVYRVEYTNPAPSITTHPADVTTSPGGTATFTVAATGQAPLAYQWRRNGTDIPGATSAGYTLANVQASDDGARFRVVVSNGVGNVLSNEALLTVTVNQPPTITTHPTDVTVSAGGSATFTVVATGQAPLAYQWRRDGADIPGATSASYSLTNVQAGDSGARFRVHVSNSVGSALSNEAALTVVTTNQPPIATITAPAAGTLYTGGMTIAFAGTGLDPEDGPRPPSAFSWRVEFHHDTHTHPFMPDTSGIIGGSFVIPRTGESSADVWYRIHLTVRDSHGQATTVHRDVFPRKVRLTLTTQPSGLQLRLDGQPVATPLAIDSVVGIQRTIGASGQATSGTTYAFAAWSDAGAPARTILTPTVDTVYTATFQAVAVTSAPSQPANLTAVVNGGTVRLAWNRAAGAQGYRIEAGTAPGLADLANADLGDVAAFQGLVPPRTYFVRVRAWNAAGISAPSTDVQVDVVSAESCTSPPPPPVNYTEQTGGLLVALSWSPSPGATSYVLEAGFASGATAFSLPLGNAMSFQGVGPAGTFYTRVRAMNGCGSSAPSVELPVTLACSSTAVVPTLLTATKTANAVTFTWLPPLGATSYRLQAGTTPGSSNIVDTDIGVATSLAIGLSGVPFGTYHVRVAAMSACGVSAPSNEVVLTVP